MATLNALMKFTAAASGSYVVDDMGVLATILSRTTTMTYRANNEIATADDYNGTTNYTFDAWGRMDTESKNGTTKTYSWTSANLLAGVTSSNSADTNVAYTYTGDLKRVWRFENSTLTNWYQWDAGFNVLNEFSNVNPMKTFVPGLAEVSGNTLATNADYHYLTTDHLGSTRGMWNQSAAQMGTWEFTPYGSPHNFSGPSDVTQLYTGHDLDRVTGQYFTPFRFLNTGIGRWVSSDSLGGGYSYVFNNPVNFVDPNGLWGIKVGGINFGWGDPNLDFDGADWEGYWGDVGDTGIGEIKGAGSALTMGIYDPCYTSDLQRYGGLVGIGLATIGMIAAGGAGAAEEAAAAELAPVWPKTAEEMNAFLKVEGKAIPDTLTTPGRNKTAWDLGESKITLEQHPYHPNAPTWHRNPHWHLDTPGNLHQRFLAGDPIPGY